MSCFAKFLSRGQIATGQEQTEGAKTESFRGGVCCLNELKEFRNALETPILCVCLQKETEESVLRAASGVGTKLSLDGNNQRGQTERRYAYFVLGDKSEIRNEQTELSKSVPEGPIFRVCPRK